MKTIFLLVLTTFLVHLTIAQELKRKASLGIRMQPLSDSLATINGLPKGKGLHILQVVPNSTASKVGINNNDVLTHINQQEVNSTPQLFETIQNIRENDNIKFTYAHKGKVINKTTKALAKPKEQYETAHVIYGQVNYGNNRLRSILYTPKATPKAPVIFFLQGYTCGSIDMAFVPENSTLKLIRDWVDAGYAVYRVEKSNVGDSDCEKGCMEMNFNEEVDLFKNAYKTLLKTPGIDTDNVYLFGHSMGGLIAPLLAEEFNPKGVMVYGVVVNSWFEYMQELTRVQGEMFHPPYAEIERDVRRAIPFWYELMVAQKTNKEILENAQLKKNLKEENILETFEAGYFMNRHYTFWQSLNQVSMVNTWLNVKSNVLAMYGEFDIQALNAEPVKDIANIVNASHPGNGTYKIIPNADHGFVYFDSMEHNVETLNNNQYFSRMQTHYHEGIAQTTLEWIKGIGN